jgi:hypothetical protein
MKTKLILAIIGVAMVAAALVGVSAAQYVGNQNATNQILTQQTPPCANLTGTVPSYCINATTDEPYCNNCTNTGYCWNNTAAIGGYCGVGGYGYGTQTQNQTQNQYGWGMMSQTTNGYGMGRCR